MMPTILSIEDSAFERKALINMLKEEGYTIEEAENGEEGLNAFEEHEPDLVLLDLRLPDMDGIDLLETLQERGADVIVVSVIREEKTIERVKEMGAHDYLTKPITAEKLLPSVKKVLG